MKTIKDETTFITSRDLGWEVWNRTAKHREDCEMYFHAPEALVITSEDIVPLFTINKCDTGWQIILRATYKGTEVSFGTVQSKSYGYKGLKIMTKLYRHILYEFYDLIDRNFDNLRREGFDISVYEKGETNPSKRVLGAPSMEAAVSMLKAFFAKDDVDRCVVRDNLTRSLTAYTKELL